MSDPELDLRRWREAFRPPGERAPGADPAGSADQPSGVDPQTLAALALGELSGEERALAADRVLSDPQALADYRTLVELHQAAGGPIEQATPQQATGARWRRAGLAAAAAVIAAAGLWLVARPADSPPVGERPVTRAAEVAVEPATGLELVSPPPRLAWPDQVGATGYRVTLLDAGGRELWTSEPSPSSRAALPPAVIAELTPGAAFAWTVEVEGPAARRRLGPFRFHIAPSP